MGSIMEMLYQCYMWFLPHPLQVLLGWQMSVKGMKVTLGRNVQFLCGFISTKKNVNQFAVKYRTLKLYCKMKYIWAVRV